jgi:hypothetical protein
MGVYYMLNTRISILSEQIDSQPPSVMAMDLDGTLKTLMADGMSASKALLYTDTMMKILKKRGIIVIVIDIKTVLSLPPGLQVEIIDEQELFTAAKKYGGSPSASDKKAIRQALNNAKNTLNE